MLKYTVILLLAAFIAYASASSCTVTITQTLGSAWTSNGQDFSQWAVTLTNTGSEPARSLLLSIDDSKFDQVWNVVKDSNGYYELPDYIINGGGIAVGGNYQFGYIVKQTSQVGINIHTLSCLAVASPSAAPASPSAAPASPSKSPASSIVASPQPSHAPSGNCQVSVQTVARSAANGGSWSDGSFNYQIFDLTITNNGNTPVTDVHLNIDASGSAIYQFWNLARQGVTSSFDMSTPSGLQVGASSVAGFITQTPVNKAAPTVTVTVTLTTCNGQSTAAPTIVASPQPSAAASPIPVGCSASLTLVARSAASGGSWTSNGQANQIFDITITNTGSRAITGGSINFGLASGEQITQFWELNRVDASNFGIPTSFGPIQVGASQGAGIVATTNSVNVPTPTLTLTGLQCQ